MNEIINLIAEKNKNNAKEGDYTNAEGILMCGKCNQPKQCIMEFPTGSGRMKKFPIVCRCDKLEEEAYIKRQEEFMWEKKQNELYRLGLSDKAYLKNTFENDDNRNPQLSTLCRKYVEFWDIYKAKSQGILLYGDTGGGKSFYSCCIANALLKKGVRVLVSRLSDLVKNRIDKNAQDVNFKMFELIVLDDLGTENTTQTAYNIIDDIYRCDIPMIVTTNLAPAEFKDCDSLDNKRIYDRVIERCCITKKVDVIVTRLQTAKEERNKALEIMK